MLVIMLWIYLSVIGANSMKKAYFKHSNPIAKIPSPETKKIILLISVGQPYHESNYLSAAINLINKEHFGFCTIAVADTLQRHNYCLKLSQDEAYNLAEEKGEAWRKRNSGILSTLNIDNELINWDTWLNHPSYSYFRKKIDDLYSLDEDYKQGIDNTINSFALRVTKRQQYPAEESRLFEALCLEYIREECAIIMPLWASLKYDFII